MTARTFRLFFTGCFTDHSLFRCKFGFFPATGFARKLH